MATMHDNNETVAWPKRAVVTAGMPYGNKPLHFGHIAGVFVPADCFARFLRDRIGAENVRFISGTDCFGSPINEAPTSGIPARSTSSSARRSSRSCMRTAGCRSARRCSSTTPRRARS